MCKFRHLLERHGLGEQIFKRVGEHLQAHGFRLSEGTIVDATLISAPQSTKNASGGRDPEMGSTRKGKKWGFGMKAHVGVDRKTKLIHSIVATPGTSTRRCGPTLGPSTDPTPAASAASICAVQAWKKARTPSACAASTCRT